MKIIKNNMKKILSVLLVIGMLLTTVSPTLLTKAESNGGANNVEVFHGTRSYNYANGAPTENPLLVAGSRSSIAYQTDTVGGTQQTVAVCTLGGNFGEPGSVYVPYVFEAGKQYSITMTYKTSDWCCSAFFENLSKPNGWNGSVSWNSGSYTTTTGRISVATDKGDQVYFGISTIDANAGMTISIASISITERITNTADYQIYDFDTNGLIGTPTPVSVENANGVATKAVYFDNLKRDTTLDVALTAGQKYRLSFDYKGMGTLWLLAFVNPWGNGSQNISAETPNTSVVHQINYYVALNSGDTWSRYEVEFTAAYAFDKLAIDARLENSFTSNGITESKLYFDNIRIEKVEEDETIDFAMTGAVNFNDVSKNTLQDAILAGSKAKVELVRDADKGQVVQCTLGGGYWKSSMVYFPYNLVPGTDYEVTVTFKKISGWFSMGYTYGTNGASAQAGFDSTSWQTVTKTITAPADKTEMYLGFGDPNQSQKTVFQIASIRIKESKANSADYQMYNFDTKWSTTTVVADSKGVEQNALYLNNSFNDLTLDYELQKGQTYKLTFDYKGTGKLWMFNYLNNAYDVMSACELSSETWAKHELTFEAKITTNKFTIRNAFGAGNTHYVDNVCITKVEKREPEPNGLDNITFESFDGTDQKTAYPSGVTVKNGATIAADPVQSHGKYSLKNNWHDNNSGIIKIEYPLEQKHIYEITLDYYFENHAGQYAKYNPWFILYADRVKGMGDHYDATYDTWKTITITFTSDKDYSYYELIANTVDAYFDNIQIKDVTPEDTEIDLKKLGNLTFDSFDGTNQVSAFPYGSQAMSGAKVVASPGGRTGYSLKNSYHTSNNGILKVEYPLEANHTYEITLDYYFDANDGTHAEKDYVPWFTLFAFNAKKEESCYGGTWNPNYGTWKTVTIIYAPTQDMAYFKLIANKVNGYFDNIKVKDTTLSQEELDALLKETAGFEKITFSDFGITDGKYQTKGNAFAVTGRRKYSLNETMLCGKMYLSKDTVLTIGGVTSGWHGLRFDVKQDGKIYLYWNGTKVEGPYATFDSSRAKTKLTDNWIDFKLSIQITDADGDGLQDDLKLCVWFDDNLYQNTYIVIPDKAADLGRRLSFACNTAGPYVEIASIPELVKGFDYAYFGLTENWEKELLGTGLSTKIAVGGSKDATPFSGDMVSILSMVVLMGAMAGAAFVTVYVTKKRKEGFEQ